MVSHLKAGLQCWRHAQACPLRIGATGTGDKDFVCVQINLETGGCLDTDLQGNLCSSAPKQRVYEVVDDSEYFWQGPLSYWILSSHQGAIVYQDTEVMTADLSCAFVTPSICANGHQRMRNAPDSWLAASCRIKLDMKEPRDSDKYNGGLLESPRQSSKSSSYGLGSSAFSQFGGLDGLESRGLGTSYSPARRSFSDDVLGSQESTTSTAFLEPFGGADNVKFYPPPSPLKPQPANDVSTAWCLYCRCTEAAHKS